MESFLESVFSSQILKFSSQFLQIFTENSIIHFWGNIRGRQYWSPVSVGPKVSVGHKRTNTDTGPNWYYTDGGPILTPPENSIVYFLTENSTVNFLRKILLSIFNRKFYCQFLTKNSIFNYNRKIILSIFDEKLFCQF